MAYANELIGNGKEEEIKSLGLWTGNATLNGGLIAFDLDFAATN